MKWSWAIFTAWSAWWYFWNIVTLFDLFLATLISPSYRISRVVLAMSPDPFWVCVVAYRSRERLITSSLSWPRLSQVTDAGSRIRNCHFTSWPFLERLVLTSIVFCLQRKGMQRKRRKSARLAKHGAWWKLYKETKFISDVLRIISISRLHGEEKVLRGGYGL